MYVLQGQVASMNSVSLHDDALCSLLVIDIHDYIRKPQRWNEWWINQSINRWIGCVSEVIFIVNHQSILEFVSNSRTNSASKQYHSNTQSNDDVWDLHCPKKPCMSEKALFIQILSHDFISPKRGSQSSTAKVKWISFVRSDKLTTLVA
jgi:hypothetical protein